MYQIIPVTPFAQNCSVHWCPETKDTVVVDPGGDIEKILSFIDEQSLNVVHVLLTHGHLDHVGGTAPVAKALNVQVTGPHVDDKFWIDALVQQGQMFGFGEVITFQPDRWLTEGESITFGTRQFDVLHCPGHTPGHVVFHDKANKLLVVGDVLFQGSVGRTDFPKGNQAQLVNSIREKLWPLGDDVEFIPGHGPMSNIGHEIDHNPFVSGRFG